MSTLINALKVDIDDGKDRIKHITEAVVDWGSWELKTQLEKRIFLIAGFILGPILFMVSTEFVVVSMLRNLIWNFNSIAALMVCITFIACCYFMLHLMYYELKQKIFLWLIMTTTYKSARNYDKMPTTIKKVQKDLELSWKEGQ